MKFLTLLAVTLLGTACAFQSATEAPIPAETAAPAVATAPSAASRTPAPVGTATTTDIDLDTLGSYDDAHNFHAFAGRLDAAIQTADMQFFCDNVVFEDLKCGVDFPDSTKPCVGKPPGALIQGIVAGVWASEGFGLDAEGYEAFIREFLTEADVSAFDAYGDPRPRLYAYGVFKPELRGSNAKKTTVAAFVTRVASGSGSRPFGPGRTVLMIHVGFDGKRWMVAGLTVTPPLRQYPVVEALLDPTRRESKEMFEYWRRWQPAPRPSQTATAAP